MYLKRTPGNILDSYQGMVYDFFFFLTYLDCIYDLLIKQTKSRKQIHTEITIF